MPYIHRSVRYYLYNILIKQNKNKKFKGIYIIDYNCKRGMNRDWNYTSLELCGIILEFIR